VTHAKAFGVLLNTPRNVILDRSEIRHSGQPEKRFLRQIGRSRVTGHSTRQESPYVLRMEIEQLGKIHAAHRKCGSFKPLIVAADNLTPSLGLSKLFTGLGHSLVT
jgi:hypothetical protein